nr:hypothetical protein [Crucivirus sp.]
MPTSYDVMRHFNTRSEVAFPPLFPRERPCPEDKQVCLEPRPYPDPRSMKALPSLGHLRALFSLFILQKKEIIIRLHFQLNQQEFLVFWHLKMLSNFLHNLILSSRQIMITECF